MYSMENALVEILVLIYYFNIVIIDRTSTILGFALVLCYALMSFQTSKYIREFSTCEFYMPHLIIGRQPW